MVFNHGMENQQSDADLIRQLGGPTKVAERMGEKKKGSAQRVQNWISRGIPAGVKLKFPHLFLQGLQPGVGFVAHGAEGPPVGAPTAVTVTSPLEGQVGGNA